MYCELWSGFLWNFKQAIFKNLTVIFFYCTLVAVAYAAESILKLFLSLLSD